MPDVDQLAAVQRAVNEYREATGGLVPIKNSELDTDIYIKYLIDFYVQVCYTESRRKEITLTNCYH